MASVLLSTVCLIIPMTMASVEYVDQDTNSVNYVDRDHVVLFSRIISLLLLIWYLAGVALKAKDEFKQDNQDNEDNKKPAKTAAEAKQALIDDDDGDEHDEDDGGTDQTVYREDYCSWCPGGIERTFKATVSPKQKQQVAASATKVHSASSNVEAQSDDSIPVRQFPADLRTELKTTGACSAFTIALFHCLICGVLAEVLTGKIDLIFGNGGGEEFLGMIVLPIAGNFFEHFTAINNIIEAAKMGGKGDLLPDEKVLLKYRRWKKATSAMSKALESVSNIAMFVFPLMVLIGWGTGQELTLDVGLLSAVVLASSVFMVAIVVSNDKINTTTGLLLILVYVVIAITYWFHSSQDYFADITSINFANGTAIGSN